MQVRTYGDCGPWLIVLHGGPGAPGYVAPVARGLASHFRVLEPFQRGSGDGPLSVARHVADLAALIAERCDPAAAPVLVGSSWGAMLALAYAAQHPQPVGPLVLIGCGTFDPTSRGRLHATLARRTHRELRAELDHLPRQVPDADERLRRTAELLLPLYSHDLATCELELETCDAQAYQETWRDQLRLEEAGIYPAAFASIRSPILMIHGDHDPHPGAQIRDSLAPHLPQLEYREKKRCGHYPWLERAVGSALFAEIVTWLEAQRAET